MNRVSVLPRPAAVRPNPANALPARVVVPAICVSVPPVRVVVPPSRVIAHPVPVAVFPIRGNVPPARAVVPPNRVSVRSVRASATTSVAVFTTRGRQLALGIGAKKFAKKKFEKKKSPVGWSFRAQAQHVPGAEGRRRPRTFCNKFIANCGICSRREADELISAGVITVNGEVVTELGTRSASPIPSNTTTRCCAANAPCTCSSTNRRDYITTVDDPASGIR